MNKFLTRKKARAAQLKSELEAVRTMIDIAPQDKLEEHYQRAKELNAELRSVNADIADLIEDNEPIAGGSLPLDDNPAGLDEYGQSERTRVVNAFYNIPVVPGIVRSNAAGQQLGASYALTRAQQADKVLFRSGEAMASKYDTTGIDAEKCLRAAITGDYSRLNDAEKRSVTPSTGGAMLAPEVSSLVIDALRQMDWLTAIQPTFVEMSTAEMKIPNIAALPTAVMHIPGEEEDSSAPTITAATLNAKTIMTVVEVANELLQDAATSQGVILQAATNAIANKLLQQVMYGTGTGAEIKGITTYAAGSFAAAGSQATEKDLFALATRAKTAILKKNGTVNAMLYDPDLEDRLNKRLPTGELVEPSRAFTEIYAAGRAIAHPSIAAGDMAFMQADALFIGTRQGLEIQIDPYSSFNSNNTKFRVIMRADAFANTARMVYYSGITEVEPE
ncbi:MAG: phage major capsid protein [Candidatus Fimivivens sp.]